MALRRGSRDAALRGCAGRAVQGLCQRACLVWRRMERICPAWRSTRRCPYLEMNAADHLSIWRRSAMQRICPAWRTTRRVRLLPCAGARAGRRQGRGSVSPDSDRAEGDAWSRSLCTVADLRVLCARRLIAQPWHRSVCPVSQHETDQTPRCGGPCGPGAAGRGRAQGLLPHWHSRKAGPAAAASWHLSPGLRAWHLARRRRHRVSRPRRPGGGRHWTRGSQSVPVAASGQ